VLGTHVQQQGSWVGVDRLRFDFTHLSDVKDRELDRIEEIVNGYVIADLAVDKKEMSLQEARVQGALAFFAEKYEDKVRIVSIADISKEFCGGIHLDRTGFIGLFKILHESSVASGVRRIEALTGAAAYRQMKEDQAVLESVALTLKTTKDKIAAELEKRLKAVKDLEKQLGSQRLAGIAQGLDQLIAAGESHKDIKFICYRIDNADMDMLRKTADMIKQKVPKVLLALGSQVESKANLVICTNVAGFDAGAMIKEAAGEIGGSGGGRKDFAQAGGTKPDKLEAAFEKIKSIFKTAADKA